MKRVLLRRPTFQMLLPVTLMLTNLALCILGAHVLSSPLFLFLGSVFAVVALIVALAWARFCYEIRAGKGLQGYIYPPMLIWRIGFLTYTEFYFPLKDLRRIVVKRPLRWFWCDGAHIILIFRNGDTFDLGVIGGATKGIELLYAAMPPRTPIWNIPVDEYDMAA